MLRRFLSVFQSKEEINAYEPFTNTYNYPGTSIDPTTDAGLAFGQAQGGISSVKQAYDQINRMANDNTKGNTDRAAAVKQAYNVNLQPPSSNLVKGASQVFGAGGWGYNLTFAEGQAKCAQLGATVATSAQLAEAQRNGADWCSSGWVAEGRGEWPITLNPVPGCGGTPGIIGWTPGERAGVNCYGPKPDINDKSAQGVMPFNEQMWNAPPPSDTPTYLTIPSGYLETSGPQPACFSGLSPEEAQRNCNALGSQCVGFSYAKNGSGFGCYKGNHLGGRNGNSAYMGYVKIQAPPPPTVIVGRYIKLQYNHQECLNLAQILVYRMAGGPNIITPNTGVTKSSGYQGDTYPSANFVNGRGDTFVHSSCYDVPWIQIDLGSPMSIYKIVVVNRKDCCQSRINGTTLYVLDNDSAPVYISNPITSTNTVYTWFPPSPTVFVDRSEDMPKVERNRNIPPPGYSQGVCNPGYYDSTKGNHAWWGCGSGCAGGKYWTNFVCNCACVPNSVDP